MRNGDGGAAGAYNAAGLPGATGRLLCEGGLWGLYTPGDGTGVVFADSTGGIWGFQGGPQSNFASGINIDLSRASAVFGASNTVMPASADITVGLYLGRQS